MDLEIGSKWICFKRKSTQVTCSTYCDNLQLHRYRDRRSNRQTQRYSPNHSHAESPEYKYQLMGFQIHTTYGYKGNVSLSPTLQNKVYLKLTASFSFMWVGFHQIHVIR